MTRHIAFIVAHLKCLDKLLISHVAFSKQACHVTTTRVEKNNDKYFIKNRAVSPTKNGSLLLTGKVKINTMVKRNQYGRSTMKLSTKSRYGVRAMFDMAYHAGNLPVQIKDISRRQNISPRYLEQIFL